MNTHRVFVYGTLMRGLRNHHKMEGAKFCGEATTLLPSYDMIQFPSNSAPGHLTPGLRRHGIHCITGEVFLVDDDLLSVLDAFEDVGGAYDRGKVMLSDGSQAWTYFLLADMPACAKGTPSFIEIDEATESMRWNGYAQERFAGGEKKVA